MKLFSTLFLALCAAATSTQALEFSTLTSANSAQTKGATLLAAGNAKGQTFHVEKPGELAGITLQVTNIESSGSLTLQIYPTTDGFPQGEALHTATAALPTTMSSGKALQAKLDKPLSLAAGDYAIALSTDDAALRLSLTNTYTGGSMIRKNASTKEKWQLGNSKDADLCFSLLGDIPATSIADPAPLKLKKHTNPKYEPLSLSDIKTQPNIISIMVDDLGWNQIGIAQATMGTNPAIYSTPNLLKLAKGGLSFTHAYAQPNCAPTRAAMISGQYPARIHNDVYVVNSLNRFGSGGISKQAARFTGPKQTGDVAAAATTAAEALQQNGYATAHIGKYHVGGHDGGDTTLPENSGFDINIGGFKQGHQPVCFASQTDDGSWQFRGLGRGDFDRFAQPYTSDYLEKYGFPSSLDGTAKHVSDALADAAEETLGTLAANDEPFYIQLHPYAVHGPVRSRPDLLAESKGDHLVGFVKSVDLIVGRILDQVDDPNGDGDTTDSIADRTIILFTSDNGGTHKNNYPLRGKKGMLTEGGIRVPLIAYWPGVIPADTVTDHLVHTVDYYPTYLQLAGQKWSPDPAEHPLDGHSFAETLLDPERSQLREPIFFLFPGYLDTRATPTATAIGIVDGEKYKIWYDYEADAWSLYAIDTDIAEEKNIIKEKPNVAKHLTNALQNWLTQEHNTWQPKYPIEKESGTPLPVPKFTTTK